MTNQVTVFVIQSLNIIPSKQLLVYLYSLLHADTQSCNIFNIKVAKKKA